MTARAKYASNGTAPGRRVHFRCPGCDRVHGVVVEAPNGWVFNGDLERPTFTPSVLVNGFYGDVTEEWKKQHPRCHSFVTDGRIQFLGDSTHALAGQTVDLPPWETTDPEKE
ncbi:hypothetical protein GCM10028801_41420 [Nocardioides maradonensis]